VKWVRAQVTIEITILPTVTISLIDYWYVGQAFLVWKAIFTVRIDPIWRCGIV
jgi:hypothetical protein